MSWLQLRGTQHGRIARLAETLVAFARVEEEGVEEGVVADGEMEIIITPHDLHVRETTYRNRAGVYGADRERENAIPRVGVEETDLILLMRRRERASMKKRHPFGVMSKRTAAIQIGYTGKHKSSCPRKVFIPTRSDCGSTIRMCSSCLLQAIEYSDCSLPSVQIQSCRTGLEALYSKKGPPQRTPRFDPVGEQTYLHRVVSTNDTEDPCRIGRPLCVVDAIGTK